MIGIDEVGRGCWAGPLLVVAARSKRLDRAFHGYKDSKKLGKKKREQFYKFIKDEFDLGEGWVTPAEIDEFGLSIAMALGVERALKDIIAVPSEEIIIDGNINYCPDKFTNSICMVKADNIVESVAVASIYAKVTRDRYMNDEAKKYPGYLFENNVGYGTKEHISALKNHGISDIHRKSYKPIARIISD